jgi:sterol 3beta-glucosyltransferase
MTDQFLWARRLHELGVAPAPIPRRDLSAERLGDAIRIAAGDDAMRRRAAALGRRIRDEDGVGRAVGVIGRHLAAAGPAVPASDLAPAPAPSLVGHPER